MIHHNDLATTIVERARALGPEERGDFVRRACGANESLLSRVLDELGESAPGQTWDEELAAAERGEYEPLPSMEGQRLGAYRILRKLGSGGMGDVYLAERADEEYQQRVAIKLVRSGAFSRQVQARLRIERQILASLQHPNVARLLDGGRAADGTPYLVMEYIEGEPIDVYCDRRRLSVEDRIRLVMTVCSAVHYAHRNLIVHRDLKPNNILITPDGVPKLLDFGIAKLLDTRHTTQSVALTQLEYRVLTPAHASPEQVRGDTITTASDIYVLGVLLYELLCGRRPFQLAGKSMLELEHIICEQEPLAPSAMAAHCAQESPQLLEDIVACRSTTAARLGKQLEGDLDTIIAMAMRKDAERRYSSAEQLAADLDHFLNGQPVVAASDTWLYRTGKFVRRHVLAVATSTLAVLLLVAFAAITFIQSQQIAHERDLATAERTRAEQVSSFLVELFKLSDPSQSRGNQVTARELLDVGARRINSGLADQPETRTTLLGTIGSVYQSLGLYSKSVELLEDALRSRIQIHGPRHPQVAAALVALGSALSDRGDWEAARARLEQALAMQRELLGPDAIEIGATLAARGRLDQLQGDPDAAQQLYDASLAIYRHHGKERSSAAASVMDDLASIHSYRGQYAQAEALVRAALDIHRKALGNDHPEVALHLQNLAVTLQLQGKLQQADPMYLEALQIETKVLGEQHPQTIDVMAHYGRFLHRKGDLAEAEAMLSRVLELGRAARGARHAFVGYDLVSRGMLRLDTLQFAEAEDDLRAALDIYAETLPADHAYVASALSALGRCQLERKKVREAEHTLRKAMAIASKSLSPQSAQLAAMKSTLGRVLLEQGRSAEAAALLQESYPILVNAQGEKAVIVHRAREAIARLPAAAAH